MFCAHTLSGESLDAATAAPRSVNGTQIATSTPSESPSSGRNSPTYWWVSETVLNIFQLPAMYGRRSPGRVTVVLPGRGSLPGERKARMARTQDAVIAALL